MNSNELFAFTALLVDGLLSVVHITDDGMSILKPLEITDTHVVVKVSHLSVFGLIGDFFQWFSKSKVSQVLLFLRPPNIGFPILDVFLLPINIYLDKVKLSVLCAHLYCDSHLSVKHLGQHLLFLNVLYE